MLTGLAIRPFAPVDAEALIDLVRELQMYEGRVYDRMKPPTEIGPWYIDALQKQCAESAGEILIGELDDVVVAYGTILIRVYVDEIDEVPYTYAYVGDLTFTAARRGQGIGKAMLAECERRARVVGTRWLRITALAGNSQARSAYRALGFEEQFVSFEKPLD